MAKYKKGDVLEVLTYDQGDEQWERGIIIITDYDPSTPHTDNGTYGIQRIKGNVNWLCVNADELNEAADLEDEGSIPKAGIVTWVKYIGNFSNDKAIEALYGKS